MRFFELRFDTDTSLLPGTRFELAWIPACAGMTEESEATS